LALRARYCVVCLVSSKRPLDPRAGLQLRRIPRPLGPCKGVGAFSLSFRKGMVVVLRTIHYVACPFTPEPRARGALQQAPLASPCRACSGAGRRGLRAAAEQWKDIEKPFPCGKGRTRPRRYSSGHGCATDGGRKTKTNQIEFTAHAVVYNWAVPYCPASGRTEKWSRLRRDAARTLRACRVPHPSIHSCGTLGVRCIETARYRAVAAGGRRPTTLGSTRRGGPERGPPPYSAGRPCLQLSSSGRPREAEEHPDLFSLMAAR
jgi:hypothetical protein